VRIRRPATSDRQFGSRAETQCERRNSGEWYARSGRAPFRTLDVRRRPPVVRQSDKAPQRNDQFACQRDDHGLARATTAVGGAGAIPRCERALLLKHQKAPGELDHGATDPGIAGSGEPLFATARAALIWISSDLT